VVVWDHGQWIVLAAKALGYDSCPMIGFDPVEAVDGMVEETIRAVFAHETIEKSGGTRTRE
jgi:hypothetical protein